jgi:hypothetical protein
LLWVWADQEHYRATAVPIQAVVNVMKGGCAGGTFLLLKLALDIVGVIRADLRRQIREFGFFLMQEAAFVAAFERRFESSAAALTTAAPDIVLPASADDLLEELECLPTASEAIRFSPAIRRAGDLLCLDLLSATRTLNALLVSPTTHHLTERPL